MGNKLILLFVILGFSVTPALAATITVSPGQSIQSAANAANPGDTIIVVTGIYNETVSVSRPGITFEADGLVNTDGFYITGNNTIVTGFIFDDVPGYGVNVRSNGSIIKNNTITKARNACIFVAGQNNLIENNDCSYTIQPYTNGGDADCFRFFGGGHIFRGNYCHDMPIDGVLVRDPHMDGFQTWNWSVMGGVGHDTIFEKNVVIFPENGKGWNIEEGAYNITIKNNVILANLIVLIIDGNNISFLNNTFVGGIGISDGLHLWRTNANVYNNIFAHQRQRVIENIDSSATITAGNNCYIDYGIMLPANPGDIRSTNALFANESKRDYHLQSSSPCLGKGAFDYSPSLSGDLNADSHVNIFDYNILVAGFGTKYNIFDYNMLVGNFGK